MRERPVSITVRRAFCFASTESSLVDEPTRAPDQPQKTETPCGASGRHGAQVRDRSKKRLLLGFGLFLLLFLLLLHGELRFVGGALLDLTFCHCVSLSVSDWCAESATRLNKLPPLCKRSAGAAASTRTNGARRVPLVGTRGATQAESVPGRPANSRFYPPR